MSHRFGEEFYSASFKLSRESWKLILNYDAEGLES